MPVSPFTDNGSLEEQLWPSSRIHLPTEQRSEIQWNFSFLGLILVYFANLGRNKHLKD